MLSSSGVQNQPWQDTMRWDASTNLPESLAAPFAATMTAASESHKTSYSGAPAPRFGQRSYPSSCSDTTDAGAQLTAEDEDELAGFLDTCFHEDKQAWDGAKPESFSMPFQTFDHPLAFGATLVPNNISNQQIYPSSSVDAFHGHYPSSAAAAAAYLSTTQSKHHQNEHLLQPWQQQQKQEQERAEQVNMNKRSFHALSGTQPMAKRSRADVNPIKGDFIERASSGSSGKSEAAQIVYRKLWSEHDDELLFSLVRKHGKGNWKKLAEFIPGKTATQCSQRWRKALDPDIIKGKWSSEEDKKLRDAVAAYGPKWRKIASVIPGRTGKQCRDRYTSRLRPEIRKIGNWTAEEDSIILKAHNELGNRWAAIQKLVPDRAWYSIKWRIETLRRNASKEDDTGSSTQGGSP
ncbi:Transcription factor MYB3R-2 [Hondaea fermentalgiana]|uniref:Transcription factor MYB3R-2 n=1 Tax=Hondaea fermentalgiana TaxID=2315210 RepID=A0A2R5G1T5_9STRA|nr:Transcription factor MYB3R-2 [Hondaea fermentalgiana]|eukprot:GBG24495.1 Transcription factor MYB3R-2 [Hondaea fermentalgiana]